MKIKEISILIFLSFVIVVNSKTDITKYNTVYLNKFNPFKISIDSLRNTPEENKFSSDIYLVKKFKNKIKDYTNAILVDLDSNKILFEKDAYKMVEIASVTKMMSILLILEDMKNNKISLTDSLITSRAASQIGGSQVYLKEKEKLSVEDLMKSIVVKSANDAVYLLAETLGKDHSVENFVKRMNQRAFALGMHKTIYYYPHGLPPSWYDRKKQGIKGNLSTCYDLALLTKELLKYPNMTRWSSIWLDSIRTEPWQKPFQLRNTNRLIKDYDFFDGLKTGFYNRAGFCVVGTAKKNNRRLVAIVLGSRNAKRRDKFTNSLVQWGFNYIEKKNKDLITTNSELPNNDKIKNLKN